jgi:hypothetical protein
MFFQGRQCLLRPACRWFHSGLGLSAVCGNVVLVISDHVVDEPPVEGCATQDRVSGKARPLSLARLVGGTVVVHEQPPKGLHALVVGAPLRQLAHLDFG